MQTMRRLVEQQKDALGQITSALLLVKALLHQTCVVLIQNVYGMQQVLPAQMMLVNLFQQTMIVKQERIAIGIIQSAGMINVNLWMNQDAQQT